MQIDIGSIENILSAMKAPNDSKPERPGADDLVNHIIKPSNEVEQMIRYYKNIIEMKLLSNSNKKDFHDIIEKYVDNRVKFVRLHPLFSQVENYDLLRQELCNKLEEQIKKELDLLYTQDVPFGYKLALKHLLPESYEAYKNEEDFLATIHAPDIKRRENAILEEYKKWGKDLNNSYISNSMYERAIAIDFYDSIVPKLDYKEVTTNANLDMTYYQQEIDYLHDPFHKEKQLGNLWNPNKDVPSIPEDDTEILLILY